MQDACCQAGEKCQILPSQAENMSQTYIRLPTNILSLLLQREGLVIGVSLVRVSSGQHDIPTAISIDRRVIWRKESPAMIAYNTGFNSI
jgi:hypothetical protein